MQYYDESSVKLRKKSCIVFMRMINSRRFAGGCPKMTVTPLQIKNEI